MRHPTRRSNSSPVLPPCGRRRIPHLVDRVADHHHAQAWAITHCVAITAATRWIGLADPGAVKGSTAQDRTVNAPESEQISGGHERRGSPNEHLQGRRRALARLRVDGARTTAAETGDTSPEHDELPSWPRSGR
jgi:hypothetical protein